MHRQSGVIADLKLEHRGRTTGNSPVNLRDPLRQLWIPPTLVDDRQRLFTWTSELHFFNLGIQLLYPGSQICVKNKYTATSSHLVGTTSTPPSMVSPRMISNGGLGPKAWYAWRYYNTPWQREWRKSIFFYQHATTALGQVILEHACISVPRCQRLYQYSRH